jgi:hypothetical protein
LLVADSLPLEISMQEQGGSYRQRCAVEWRGRPARSFPYIGGESGGT